MDRSHKPRTPEGKAALKALLVFKKHDPGAVAALENALADLVVLVSAPARDALVTTCNFLLASLRKERQEEAEQKQIGAAIAATRSRRRANGEERQYLLDIAQHRRVAAFMVSRRAHATDAALTDMERAILSADAEAAGEADSSTTDRAGDGKLLRIGAVTGKQLELVIAGRKPFMVGKQFKGHLEAWAAAPSEPRKVSRSSAQDWKRWLAEGPGIESPDWLLVPSAKKGRYTCPVTLIGKIQPSTG